MKNYGFQNSLNIIELSDAFRRHASFSNPDEVRKLVEEGRKIAVLSTYYHPEYPDLPEHKSVDAQIFEAVREIAGTAQRLNVDSVILPLSGDRRSWVARRVNALLKDANLPVKISLQKSAYRTDLSVAGQIDKSIKTALDKGVRGVMNIKTNLIYGWDR